MSVPRRCEGKPWCCRQGEVCTGSAGGRGVVAAYNNGERANPRVRPSVVLLCGTSGVVELLCGEPVVVGVHDRKGAVVATRDLDTHDAPARRDRGGSEVCTPMDLLEGGLAEEGE